MTHTWDPHSIAPEHAIQRLAEGNLRFIRSSLTRLTRGWDPELAAAPQRPFAIILGCSDSRIPVEIVFDQGFGDLFVVRVAGNIVTPAVVGSIELAATAFGSRLVVVMGHTRCGAISATVQALGTGRGAGSGQVRQITDAIAPNIAALIGQSSRPEALREAMRANVRASVEQLRHGGGVLQQLVEAGRVSVVGSEYELETGTVHFLELEQRVSQGPRGAA